MHSLRLSFPNSSSPVLLPFDLGQLNLPLLLGVVSTVTRRTPLTIPGLTGSHIKGVKNQDLRSKTFSPQCFVHFIRLLRHRTVECFGLGGTFKPIPCHPCHGQGYFHYPRLLQAPLTPHLPPQHRQRLLKNSWLKNARQAQKFLFHLAKGTPCICHTQILI